MSYQSLAFFTGLFGSLHCLVMCGPLVMSIPFQGGMWFSLFQKVIYQAGRVFTYALLGAIAGSIGGLFTLAGWQQALSLVTGALLIGVAVSHFKQSTWRPLNGFYNRLFNPLVTSLGRMLSRPYGSLFAGFLHGLIPCGMVYVAIAGSLNAGSTLQGAEFMLYFGLGTTPMLIAVSLFSSVVKRFRAPRLMVPALFVIAGSLLIIRALNVDVPYITSPVPPKGDVAVCD
ncbi:MAG: sulfite exporter TauE/SafE family protein [Daejeonella sp.]